MNTKPMTINTRPVALDLCQGKRGWTNGLIAAGWYVIGFDIEDWGPAPEHSETIIRDVREVDGKRYNASLVVASPPCQEFSYRSFPFKRCRELAATVPPDTSIWEACVRIAKECNAPLVLENVRGAQKYMGKAAAHYGSYYLWGDVPAMLPIGGGIKGFKHNYEGITKCSNRFEDYPHSAMGSKTVKRKEWSANAAMIPYELALWVGACFYPRTSALAG